MKRIFVSLSCLLLSTYLWATDVPTEQVSQVSMQLLDQVSEKYKNSTGTELQLTIILKDEKTGIENSSKGNLKTLGSKFKLQSEYAGLLYDGKYLFTYNKQTNEVNITQPANDEIRGVDPTALLSSYKTGYKVNPPETFTEGGKTYLRIDLFPESREVDFFKVSIVLTSDTHNPYSISTFAKNGVTNTIQIKKMLLNQNYTDETFYFHAKDYPKNVQIIDLR